MSVLIDEKSGLAWGSKSNSGIRDSCSPRMYHSEFPASHQYSSSAHADYPPAAATLLPAQTTNNYHHSQDNNHQKVNNSIQAQNIYNNYKNGLPNNGLTTNGHKANGFTSKSNGLIPPANGLTTPLMVETHHPAPDEPTVGGPLSCLWDSNLAQQIANFLPTPPESPPPPDSLILPHNGFTDATTSLLGLKNLLRVSTSNRDRYYLTRKCCYVFHCLNVKVNFNYATLPNKLIVGDHRVMSAIEQTISEEMEDAEVEEGEQMKLYAKLMAKHLARAQMLLQKMKSDISSRLVRLTGYVLFKVFSRLLMSVTVHSGQLETIDRAAVRDKPVIFIPLHRSHVDYLFVTWVLFNRQIPAPLVAAGDNLRIPFWGWLLRGLGGFFIKRRMESSKARKDHVYRALLQTYVTHALQSGYNLEFFIEGGRTRTGKPLLPKGGLLSVIVDAYNNGTLDDALIVPIAINYEKLMDGNFIREQMGQSKVPESFWGACSAIMKVLNTNYGHARIDFAQPFSLREFVSNYRHNSNMSKTVASPNTSSTTNITPPSSPTLELSITKDSNADEQPALQFASKGHNRSYSSPNNRRHLSVKRTLSNPLKDNETLSADQDNNLHEAKSNSSLFGTEVTDDYRTLVKTLANHIVYDAERCQAIMSTNAVSWLLSFVYRDGAKVSDMIMALDALRETLRSRDRDTGFSGSSIDVVKHAVSMLGNGLVQIEASNGESLSLNNIDEETFVRPVTLLPNVIELNYYASALAPIFATDAIVVLRALTLTPCQVSTRSQAIKVYYAGIHLHNKSPGRHQVVPKQTIELGPCCHEHKKLKRVDQMVFLSIMVDKSSNQWRADDSDEEEMRVSMCYKVVPTTANLEVISAWTRMLTPILDAYNTTAHSLRKLVNKQTPDKEFIRDVQTQISTMLEKGTLRYGESICADPIRNCVKLFEENGVLESYTHDSVRVLYLSHAYNSEEQLSAVIRQFTPFRTE
ncbi:unnamed protein product, partial [Meganyctiphanes norvegica]